MENTANLVHSRRSRRRSLTCAVFALLVVIAATGPRAAGQTPGTVSGAVTNDGEPVPGVSITIRDASGGKVGGGFTTAEGTYSISVSESGTYQVELDPQTLPDTMAVSDDQLSVPVEVTDAGAVADFSAGESSGGEEVKGRLRFPNPDTGVDDPIAGVTITAELDDEPVGSAVTDPDGAWAIPLPGPGVYTIRLDVESLPDGVSIRESGDELLSKTISGGQSANLLFALGTRSRDATDSIAERGSRLFVEGINFGLIIAICAIGLSLIFGTTGLTNFAHGEMVTIGAVIAYFINVTVGWHILIAAPLAIALGGAFGAALDLGLWRPLRRRSTGLVAAMIISIGLALVLRYAVAYQFGEQKRKYKDFQVQTEGLEFGPVTIIPRDLWSMAIAIVVLVGVALMLQRTRIGKAMRAVSDNRDLAASSGINVDRVVLFVWFLGGALSTLGGVLLGLDEDLSFEMGFRLLLLMFAGVTLGGLGTAYGAFVGSMVVGLFVLMSTLVIKPELKNVGALAVLVLVLLVRPQGILGRKERIG